MSDDQKIWFIYLTDHHEGPFTAAEIAEKAKAGLVNGQSLAWKDGMPEWVAAETIPELAPGIGGAAAPAAEPSLAISGNTGETQTPAPAAAAEAPAEQGEVSLAQLLAQSQKGAEGTSSGTVSGVITDSASVLSSMASSVQANTTITKGSVSIGGGVSSPGSADPGTDDEVWTLKIGSQVSGLHSLRKLTELAAAGEIPSDAMLWHPGWSDFQPTSAVPQVEASRKQNTGTRTGITGAGGTKPGMTRTGATRPGMAMSAQSNSALDSDDEPTDTELEAPPPPGVKGILFRIHKFVEKRKRAAAKGKAAPAAAGGKTMTGIKAPAKKGSASVKRLAITIGAIAVLAGAGAGAFYFLSGSSIPASVEVSPSDREQMAAIVGAKAEEGHKLYLAQSVGTEDNPADPTAPKYYVASNMPEGTKVSLQVTGVPGTLVNRVAFDKTFTASVDKDHIATFEGITDEGKALWGEFNLHVKAEGAEPLEAKKRFIGLKGGSYQKRLATYKESVQADYDKEIGELREYITTLKNIQTEASKLIADYKRDWANASLHAKITGDWANFTKTSSVLLSQLEAPVKNRQPGGSMEAKFHGRAFQDVGTTVSQLEQLVKAHGDRLAGMTPTANADELDGLVQAGVQALEAWLAQAVAKTPFDGAKTPDSAAKPTSSTPPPAAATPPPAAPAVTPLPAAAPAAAPAPAPAAPAPAATAAPAPAGTH